MKADSARRLRVCARGRVESCWDAVFLNADQTGIKRGGGPANRPPAEAEGVYMSQSAACPVLLMLQCQYPDVRIFCTCYKCKTIYYTVQSIHTAHALSLNNTTASQGFTAGNRIQISL